MYHPQTINFTTNNFYGPTYYGPPLNFQCPPNPYLIHPVMFPPLRRRNVHNQATVMNERRQLEMEKRQLEKKKLVIAAKREELSRETQEIGQKRQEMAKEWEKLGHQREEIDGEREAMQREKDEICTKRKELASENKKIAQERAQFELERKKMAREREEFIVERAEMARKRTAGSIRFFEEQNASKRTKVAESEDVSVVYKSSLSTPPVTYNQVNNYTININAPVKIRPIASKRQAAIKANKMLAMIADK